MKLIPAEEIADKLFGSHSSTSAERFTQLQEIRQIQADTLRFAIKFSSEHQFGPFTAFSDLEQIANQLHPLPDSKSEVSDKQSACIRSRLTK